MEATTSNGASIKPSRNISHYFIYSYTRCCVELIQHLSLFLGFRSSESSLLYEDIVEQSSLKTEAARLEVNRCSFCHTLIYNLGPVPKAQSM